MRLRLLGLVVAALLVVPAARGASNMAPNIIVIMVDDLDSWSLARAVGAGFMPNLKTGVIDRGMTFVNSFVTNSLCCPSRATFLTGQYSHNHGVLTNGGTNGGVTRFDDRSTLATWLQAAGYRTGYIGKYLNGYGTDDVNGDDVIDVRDAQYVPPGWSSWEVLIDPSTYRVYDYSLNDNGQIVRYGDAPADYQTDVLAARAVRFIEDSVGDTAPFFLTVMPAAPHDEVWPGMPDADDVTDLWRWTIPPPPRYADTVQLPLPQGPSFNEADISDKPPWMNQLPPLTESDVAAVQEKYRNRLEAMRAVDDMIGSMLTRLTSSGQLSRTVIVFTSDNGFLLGQHRTPGKLYPYEESIRVPLTIVAPGITTGQVATQMVVNNDLAPTIADLARAAPQLQMDGRSLTPVLQDTTLVWRRRFLIEHWANDPPAPLDLPSFAAVRTAGLLWVEHGGTSGRREFYDLSVDPYQLTSLHGDTSSSRAFQKGALAQMLGGLRSCGNGSCQTTEFHTFK